MLEILQNLGIGFPMVTDMIEDFDASQYPQKEQSHHHEETQSYDLQGIDLSALGVSVASEEAVNNLNVAQNNERQLG